MSQFDIPRCGQRDRLQSNFLRFEQSENRQTTPEAHLDDSIGFGGNLINNLIKPSPWSDAMASALQELPHVHPA